jgi:hypothetical protein
MRLTGVVLQATLVMLLGETETASVQQTPATQAIKLGRVEVERHKALHINEFGYPKDCQTVPFDPTSQITIK